MYEEITLSIYVLVHGAWHTGEELDPVAQSIRLAGHRVFTPTAMGNRVSDSKAVGLAEAIQSIVDYLVENNLREIVLVGHSYGGMIITGLADTVPDRVRRLVYWNAFVPNNGESVTDMVPQQYVELFHTVAAERGMDAWSFHFQSGKRHSLMTPISKRRVVRTTP